MNYVYKYDLIEEFHMYKYSFLYEKCKFLILIIFWKNYTSDTSLNEKIFVLEFYKKK